MSFAEIKKAVNSDLDIPLNKLIKAMTSEVQQEFMNFTYSSITGSAKEVFSVTGRGRIVGVYACCSNDNTTMPTLFINYTIDSNTVFSQSVSMMQNLSFPSIHNASAMGIPFDGGNNNLSLCGSLGIQIKVHSAYKYTYTGLNCSGTSYSRLVNEPVWFDKSIYIDVRNAISSAPSNDIQLLICYQLF